MTWNLAAARRRCRHGEARTRRLPAHVAADVRDVARASGFPGGRRLINAHISNTALHLAAKRLTKVAGSGCVLAHRRATWRGILSSRSPLIQCTCSKVQHGWTSCSRAQLTITGQGPRLLKSRHPAPLSALDGSSGWGLALPIFTSNYVPRRRCAACASRRTSCQGDPRPHCASCCACYRTAWAARPWCAPASATAALTARDGRLWPPANTNAFITATHAPEICHTSVSVRLGA